MRNRTGRNGQGPALVAPHTGETLLPNNVVIVGAGQAAAQAVTTLRTRGHNGSIVVIGDEPVVPYRRPPLSKGYLCGGVGWERLRIRARDYYDTHKVELRLGRRAASIDRVARRVRLDDGSELPYDALLLATGSRPRTLSLPGSQLPGIHLLRTAAHADAMRAEIGGGRRIAIIGAGYIGLECAATFREASAEVTVIEAADRVMSRTACAVVSAFFHDEHTRRGVRLIMGTQVAGFDGDTRVRSVLCRDGTVIDADVALVGIGVGACDELAGSAGLRCDDGVVVDAHCRTSDPAIYAAGDCTNHFRARYGRRFRLESVDNAMEQATNAALNMLGIVTELDSVPWFWSEQYDLRLQIAGLSAGHEEVIVRGDPGSRIFSACYVRGAELLAVDTINNPAEHRAARTLLTARARFDIDRLRDANVALSDCVLAGG